MNSSLFSGQVDQPEVAGPAGTVAVGAGAGLGDRAGVATGRFR